MTTDRRWRGLVFVGLVALAGACGNGSDEELTGADHDRLRAGTEGLAATDGALAVADLVLAGGSAVDLGSSVTANAEALAATAQTRARCATVGRAATTVTLDFGAGCTASGLDVSGACSLEVQRPSADTIAVSLTYSNLSVGGVGPLSGTSTFSVTSGAGGLVVALDLTTPTATVTGPLTVTSAEGSITVDGALTVASGAGPAVTATLAAVTFTPGSCYPSAGAITFTDDVTLTFLPTTPQTGQAQVTKGRLATTLALPSYGSCPPAG
jgi:hypothetical protein